MKRILINATHAEEVRVALCNDKHLYDFDLENRTREQKKSNIYKGRVTRVEPSLEAVFVEYGAERQGFLPIREIASEYLAGDPRSVNSIKQLIKEGDELIVQVEKEERGNKGAALSTYISLAGRYLVLMPNNPRGGGISRQISGKVREELKQALASFNLPKGMSVIVRTAGIGKSVQDLHLDLDHLLSIWQDILQQSQKFPAPRLVHQEAGVVTRAMRDYLRDDIAEIWVDNEYAFNEAYNFIENVMPQQLSKLRKYTNYVPMFTRFDVEKQIETAYQREVRLPSGGSIVIDQTEALVSIDINSSKATKGADVSETAFNTNLEAADEIARQLRLRDMGGLIVIDFIDMATEEHQKQVENRLKEATKNDRARIQFAEISRFGLLEMSRQRVRPSLEETTGGRCPRCHGTGMIRDLRSLALSIMRQIEEKALQENHGEIQADVPTDIAAFLLNEKRDSLVYLEQESGVRITILPHAHLESPAFHITFNPEGYAPSSYDRVNESQAIETKERGYDTSTWHTEETETYRQNQPNNQQNAWSNTQSNPIPNNNKPQKTKTVTQNVPPQQQAVAPKPQAPQSSAVAWLSNLFAPTQQAKLSPTITSQDAAAAIESIVNTGAKSLGIQGQLAYPTAPLTQAVVSQPEPMAIQQPTNVYQNDNQKNNNRKPYNNNKPPVKKTSRPDNDNQNNDKIDNQNKKDNKENLPKREPNSRREPRAEKERRETLTIDNQQVLPVVAQPAPQPTPVEKIDNKAEKPVTTEKPKQKDTKEKTVKVADPNNVQLHVYKVEKPQIDPDNGVHVSLDNSKGEIQSPITIENPTTEPTIEPVVNQQPMIVEPVIDTPILTEIETDIENVIINHVTTEENEQTNIEVVETVVTEQQPTMIEPVVESKPTLNVIPTQGRAKNDPREVYQAYLQAHSPVVHTETVPTTVVQPISGTVKQFILQQLADGQAHIDNFGIVSSFIKAVDSYYQALQPTPVAPQPQPIDKAEFDKFFANYGYDNLSQDNLDNYHEMISPSNQYHTQAGKTQTSPTPVTKRAINDPRGQVISPPMPDDLELTVEQTQIELYPHNQPPIEPIIANIIEGLDKIDVQQSVEPMVEISTTTTQNPYPSHTVGAWIVERLGQTAIELIEQGKLVQAYLQAHQTMVATETETETITVQPETQSLSVLNETYRPMPTLEDLPRMVDLEHASLSPISASVVTSDMLPDYSQNETTETEIKDEQPPKSKTTPASYKNMIESVAEQMKPTTLGVLNLTTPKVAKPRKKSTPTPVKVRTSKKAENAVVITKKTKVTPTSETDNNTPPTE